MTQNQLRNKELQETKRSNKVREEQQGQEIDRKKRRDKWEKGTAIANAVTNPLGKILSGVSKINDPSWYSGDPQLVKDAASLPFGIPIGVPGQAQYYTPGVATSASSAFEGAKRYNRHTPSGVMSIRFMPTLGSFGDDMNTINTASRQIYSFVRHANSGSANYEGPDLMMYLLAMDSIYTYHAWMTRIYSLCLTSKVLNRYYSKGFAKAENWNFDDICNNLSNFRQYINTYAARANALAVPNIMTYYTRHVWMASSIFKDGDTRKSSDYVFTPGILFKFNPTKYLTGGCLEQVPIFSRASSTGLTFALIKEIGNSMLDALIGEEDIGIMSGDILKAFGSEGLYTLNSIPDDYHIEAIYSQEVLSQINNATSVLRENTSSIYAEVLQKNGIIFQGGWTQTSGETMDPVIGPVIVGSSSLLEEAVYPDLVVNMYKDDVTPDDVMVATRLMVSTSHPTQDITLAGASFRKERIVLVSNCGSEVVLNIAIAYTGDNLNTFATRTYCDGQQFRGSITANSAPIIEDTGVAIGLYQSFDWAPRIRLNLGVTNGVAAVIYDSLDYSNYTYIDKVSIDRMHSVALYSMLGIFKLFTGVKKY